MRKYSFRRTPPHYLILSVALACTPVAAQTAIPSPLLVLQDSANDTATLPLLEVIGGSQSKTQGAEITSQSQSTTGSVLPPLSTIMPQGYGGLSLVQTGGFTAPNTGAGGQDSPVFAMCAQQLIDSTDTSYACWDWQVLGGGTATNPSDLLTLTRVTQNNTHDLTLQVPDALNIATGSIDLAGAHHGGQLTIGALPSMDTDISLKYITVVGGFTSSGNSGAKANPLQLFPGWLSSPNAASTAYEGSLQIGMMVKAGTGSSNNLLACYSTTAQTAVPCGTLTTVSPLAAPLLGVYSPLGCPTPTTGPCSTGGSAAVVAPPSRAVVSQNLTTATPATWTAGTPVCRDPSSPTNGSYVVATTTACPIGQAVGVAVGDDTTLCPCLTHTVDLDFAPQGTTSSGSDTTYATAAASLTSAAAGTVVCADGSGNVTTTSCETISVSGQGWTMLPTVSYSPVPNSSAALVASGGNVPVLQIFIPTKIVVGHADMFVQALSASASQSMTFGLYDATGTKVLDAGTFDCSSGGTTGPKQNTASATILPGVYYYAWGSTATDCLTNSVAAATNVQSLLTLGGAKRLGTVTGASLSSGSLPPSITLSNVSNTGAPLPVTVIEP